MLQAPIRNLSSPLWLSLSQASHFRESGQSEEESDSVFFSDILRVMAHQTAPPFWMDSDHFLTCLQLHWNFVLPWHLVQCMCVYLGVLKWGLTLNFFFFLFFFSPLPLLKISINLNDLKCSVQHSSVNTEEKATLNYQQFIRGLTEVTYCSSIQLNKTMGFLSGKEENWGFH